MSYETILFAVVAAALYAGTAFMKQLPTDKPEQFDRTKFLATIILGGLIGVVAALKGIVPDQTSVELQLALYAGTTVVIENGIKIVVRFTRKFVEIKWVGWT
jgi:hypothetical protein